MNHRKADFEDVVDPYAIQTGWFRLSFTTFALLPDPNLSAERQGQVRATIARLELNDDDSYVNERARVVYRYADKKLPLNDLAKLYPFIASEMRAQSFDQTHLPRFETALANPKLRGALVRQGWIA